MVWGTPGEPVVLAVDIGSSGVRVLAYDETYKVLAGSARRVTTTVRADGSSTHAWDDLAAAVTACIREAAAAPSLSVEAVVLSGTASCLAASTVQRGESRRVEEILLWSDTRAAAQQPALTRLARERGIYERTACPSHVSYWPAKLRWLADHGRGPGDGPLFFASAKDYVFELLTGEFWTDPMTAASSGIFDSRAWRWDEELLEVTGLRLVQLPLVKEATVHAPMRREVAAELGLSPSTAVVAGGMDGPLAQLGAAGFSTEIGTCTVGTSIAFRAAARRRLLDPDERTWCYPVSWDHWVVGGAGSNGGNLLTWVADAFGRHDAVDDLLVTALAIPPDPHLLFLPYLIGERSPLWRDDLRGALIGLAAHHGAADVTRAALDGVASAIQELAVAVTSCAGKAAEVRLTGGFLRQGSWAQLVTDALGVRTCVPEPDAATCTGAAVLAWMSLGQPRPEPPAPARAAQEREPDPEAHAVLAEKSERLQAVRAALYPEKGSPLGAGVARGVGEDVDSLQA